MLGKTTTLVISIAIASGLSFGSNIPQTTLRPDAAAGTACKGGITWSSGRFAGEDYLNSGSGIRIDEFSDGTLLEIVDQWMWAYRRKDVGSLLRLMISLSNEHLEVERKRFEAILEEAPEILDHYVYYLSQDETNPAHVGVYTPVVFVLNGSCIECGIMTEWVRLDGRWYTLPDKQRIYSGARRARRPNERFVCDRIQTTSDEVGELIELIDDRTNETHGE